MSQFTIPESKPFGADPDHPPRTSGLAVASFVCSLIFCCPLVTVLGPILGVISLVQIRANAMLRGAGLAIAGIVLGTLFTLGCMAFWFVPPLSLALIEQIWPIQRLPAEALAAASAGDADGFRSRFHGDGETAPDEVAQAFMRAMTDRYGAFQSIEVDPQPGASPTIGETEIDMEYLAQFERGPVTVEVIWVLADPQTGAMVFKMGSVRLFDPTAGDLVYPPMLDAIGDAPPEPATLPEPPASEDR